MQNAQSQSKELKGIIYASLPDKDLKLDLYLPEKSSNPRLIVYVHGGAWRRGTRESVPVKGLLHHGIAIASVDYRLTTEAPFPANVHDIKASVRFLRANANKYGYSPDKIVIMGSSAGGHLAALVGVTNGHSMLEGSIGKETDTSSDIAAIVSFYGASNLETILHQSTPHGLNVRIPALELLLGGRPEDKLELARLASPVRHVDKSDPPLLLIHGDQDHQMPVNQSIELFGAYKEAESSVKLKYVYGGKHGGEKFYNTQMINFVAKFIRNSQ